MIKTYLSELRLYICNNLVCKIPSHTIRLWFYKNIMKFKIGTNSYVYLNCKFDSTLGLTMKNNVVINPRCRLDTRGTITIGEHVGIAEDVIILTSDHNVHSKKFEGRNLAVRIDDYAWVGTRAMILAGVTLNKGCVVAAGSVVTKSIPPYEIWAGVPAKKIGVRDKDLLYVINYKRVFH
ncbi:acyltransferase [Kriegella sp. EG-1]|nr:acyltransferase [Flavobacteriaceae bacterium EG-1]